MTNQRADQNSHVRYQADEKPPLPLTIGLGLQFAILSITPIVITPAIIARAAGTSDAYVSWMAFAAVLISGAVTITQAIKIGRIGAGYVLLMGTSGAFIAVCIAALVQGGPALMATLVLVSSLFQFLFASRLALLRRILNPTVSGTVIMLIPVTVLPIVFGILEDVPSDAPPAAAPVCFAVTLLSVILVGLKARGALRLWAPVIGVVLGSVIAGYFGIYDLDRVHDSGWFGLPDLAWPGLDLSFGPSFWALLPGFVLVTLVGAIETIGDAVGIQRVSWRTPRAIDYRAVQGAVNADGLGNLLSGIAGTVPNTTYSSPVAITELTGVAARSVGVAIGGSFLCLAFLPKFLELILAIPGPVVAGCVIVLLAMLFVIGMKVTMHDGLNHRNTIISGVAFWIGAGFQSGMIFGDFFSEFAGGLLSNGMTAGGFAAIAMTLFVELTGNRRRRLKTKLDTSAIPQIHDFLGTFVSSQGWGDPMRNRVQLSAEEALTSLVAQRADDAADSDRDLLVQVQRSEAEIEIELVAGPANENLEDTLTMIEDFSVTSPELAEDQISLRVLRHFASSVRHYQYHGTDVLVIQVRSPKPTKNPT